MPQVLLLNPHKRRRRRRKMTAKQRRYFGNPSRRKHHRVHRRRHHYHHNPTMGNIGGAVMPTLKGGLIGAAGGLASDILYGQLTAYMPGTIPTFAANPAVSTAVKLATSIVIGIVGNMALRGKGGELAVGAATCAIHDFAKSQFAAAMPSFPLGDYITAAPTVGARGRFALTRGNRAVGSYITGRGSNRPVRAMGEYLGDSTFRNGIPVA